MSSRGLSTGSSNKKYKYIKLDLSRFMLDSRFRGNNIIIPARNDDYTK
ncbi:MAG: palindromic element RPE4 domain-containing protein [Rickettsia sp.]